MFYGYGGFTINYLLLWDSASDIFTNAELLISARCQFFVSFMELAFKI